ncbi:MAG: hypothetical protein Q7R35_14315 [Elusimicrobiota bacterium]|nr:hypothetical protein [Elusimicrobiota bacterium]
MNSPTQLLSLFSPPQDHLKGITGAVCGFSAEKVFVEAMLECFSGKAGMERARIGRRYLSMFLDPHAQPLYGIPGLYCHHPEAIKWEDGKVKLMHAKAALLGFGHDLNKNPTYFRLIISTGNWTREAVNNSINLVWHCDHDCENSDRRGETGRDVREAAKFFDKLKSYYFLCKAGPVDELLKYILLDNRIRGPKRKTRFISTLTTSDRGIKNTGIFMRNSLGAQVFKKMSNFASRRNTIICGSGFFEKAEKTTKGPPAIISGILAGLKEVLPTDSHKFLVINPGNSGAVGKWIKECWTDEFVWVLPQPEHPHGVNSSLHAKYIFIGNSKNGKLDSREPISGGVLYLGSGNLSKQGFALAPGCNGNIEAGIVIDNIENFQARSLAEALGFSSENTFSDSDISEGGGDEAPFSKNICQAPPILLCTLNKEELSWDWSDSNGNWSRIKIGGIDISPQQTRIPDYKLPSGHKGEIELQAVLGGKHHKWSIPVLTPEGNFSPLCQTITSGAELIDILESFPAIAYEEDDFDEDGGEAPFFPDPPAPAPTGGAISADLRQQLNRYPLHLATTLVESLASKNQHIGNQEMFEWIESLRRSLIRDLSPELKKELISLGKKHFAVLKNTKGFAPPHPTPEYEHVIVEILADWQAKISVEAA